MKAIELHRSRVVYSSRSFAELVLWRVPKPVVGSRHPFKYRLAYIFDGRCVIRYDNETGKGDHRHIDKRELPYQFSTPERLVADFQADILRWNDENPGP